jgi:hypothetical protein
MPDKTLKLMLGGVMLGDAFHAIPLLNRFLDGGWTKIIWMCGSYMKPVVEFLSNFYPIEVLVREDLAPPDSMQTRLNFKKHYQDAFNQIVADGEYYGEYETFDWIAYSEDSKNLNLDLRNMHLLDGPVEDSIVIHPYTLHTWKNTKAITEVNWSIFDRTTYTAGGTNEPHIAGSIDLRGKPFFEVAQKIRASQLGVVIHSAIACLSMYLNHPSIVIHPWGDDKESTRPTFLSFGYFKPSMIDIINPSNEDLIEAVKQKLTN